VYTGFCIDIQQAEYMLLDIAYTSFRVYLIYIIYINCMYWEITSHKVNFKLYVFFSIITYWFTTQSKNTVFLRVNSFFVYRLNNTHSGGLKTRR